MALNAEKRMLVILVGVLILVSVVGTIAVVAEYNRVSRMANYTIVADEKSSTHGFVSFRPSNPQSPPPKPVDEGGKVKFDVR
ncbi:MAG TPA: hypothetical protein ENN46_02405 [Candidatus Woesearchaeota archaeon]|nr:hypothetical protein [Candidatus Woesearchaeota archaeon]